MKDIFIRVGVPQEGELIQEGLTYVRNGRHECLYIHANTEYVRFFRTSIPGVQLVVGFTSPAGKKMAKIIKELSEGKVSESVLDQFATEVIAANMTPERLVLLLNNTREAAFDAGKKELRTQFRALLSFEK